MNMMAKEELLERAARITGGSLERLTVEELQQLMTVTQFVTNICLNEIEDRGELIFYDETPVIPYQCDHHVETILTREC